MTLRLLSPEVLSRKPKRLDIVPEPITLELDEDTFLESLDRAYPEIAQRAKSSVDVLAEVIEFANTNPDAFLVDLRTKGRTPDTEIMLRGFGFKDEEIDEVFLGAGAVSMPEPEKPNISELLTKALPKVVTPDTIDKMLEFFSDKPDVLRSNLITVGRNPSTEALVVALYPGITDQQVADYFSSAARRVETEALRVTETGEFGTFTAGVGGLISNIGGAFKWLGAGGIGEHLTRAGQFMQVRALPVEPEPFSWQQLFNPNSYFTQGLIQSLPSLMILALPALGAYGLAGSISTKVGLGAFKKAILTGVGGAIMSRPIESAMEAGGAYDAARAKGMSDLEAKEVASQVFRNNLALAALDATQIAVMFLPAPARVSSSLITKGLVTTATVGGKLVYTGLTEGGEEVLQDIIMRQALDEEIVWDAEMQQVFAIGTFAGVAMGAGGDIIVRIQNRVVGGFDPTQKAQFDESKASHDAEGFSDDVAAQKALDDMVEADEAVAKSVEDVTKQVEKEITIEQLEADTPVEQEVINNLKDKLAQEGEIVIEPAPEAIPTPMTRQEEEIIKKDLSDLRSKLPTAPAEETALIENRIAQLEGDLERGEALIGVTPEIVPEVKPIGEVKAELTDAIVVEVEAGREVPPAIAMDLRNKGLEPTRVNIEPLVDKAGEQWLREWHQNLVTRKPPAVEEVTEAPEPSFSQGITNITDEQAIELREAGLEVTEPFPSERQVIGEGGEIIPPEQSIVKGVSDNTLIVKDIGARERVRPSRHVFEKMGLHETYKGIQRAEVEIGEARVAFDKKLKEVNKWVKKDRRHLVFRELENPGTMVGLTFDEKRAVAWFKQFFDEWADTLNLPAEKRIENYVTHIFEAELAQQLQETGAIDPTMSRAMEYKTPKTIFNPFLQERLGKTGVLEDPFAAASAYEARELKVLYYEPHLQKIAAIANDLNTPETARRYLLDYSRRMTNKPANIDTEINTTLRELGEKLDKLPGGNILANYLNRGNPVGMASYNFTSALYALWLGFKPTSAIRNLSQHTLIIGEVGPVHFANGIRLRFTEEGKQVLREGLAKRGRKAAFMPGIDDSFASQWVDKFRETALFMFRGADAQNVSDASLAGYSEARAILTSANDSLPTDKKLSQGELRRYFIDRADEVAADTQYLYTKMNSMAISQSAPGRVFSVLTTWTVNWMELMTKWVSRRPSQVYLEFERATGQKVSGANWSTSYKAILMYMVIVGLGYAIKEQTRLRAWEYTGITSVRYLADIVGGDFPGLEAPGAVADIIVGFLTNDDQRLSTGWNQLKRTLTPGIMRQIQNVAEGERDWLTLFFYLDGQDYKLKKLKLQWEKQWEGYPTSAEDKAKKQWRVDNPTLEAKMFMTNRFSVLSSDRARSEVIRLIEEHAINTEFINGYEKVFGIDSSIELKKTQGTLGTEKPHEEGEDIDYVDMGDFSAEVNKSVRNQGRDKVIRDGNELAIEYLEAKDSFVQYEAIEQGKARMEFREQFPDIEAQLYLWGQITAFQNPESATILLDLMDKYDIPPQAIRAFKDKPEKYDELLGVTSEEPTPEPTTPEGIRAFEGLLR